MFKKIIEAITKYMNACWLNMFKDFAFGEDDL